MDMENITEEIRIFLSSTGLPQCVLAKEAGVSTATISRIWKKSSMRCLSLEQRTSAQLCAVYPHPAHPLNPKRPAMLADVLLALGVAVVVILIIAPAR